MRPAPKTGIMKASGEMEHSHDPDEYGFPETPCPKGYPGCEFFGCYGPDAVPEITATSERYQVRIWCDGDELSLPFVIHSGSHATQVRIWHDSDELSLPFVDWQMAMMGAETATRYGTNTSVQLGG